MEPEIYARIKPLNYRFKNCLTKNDKELVLSLPENHKYGAKKTQTFYLNKIFDTNSTQSELFNQVCRPTIEDLFSGVNSLLVFHGASKSGTEYTIYGNERDNGIIQESFFLLFSLIERHKSNFQEQVPQYYSDSDESDITPAWFTMNLLTY
ncbi:kinesin KIF23 isoform X3 [Brachionus plicatilis]|uniref:Kinesin KIF23 isoform X3 n=1 Tax=Brachionus plicatilis TaxID=10195 RepID=A0A3M7SJR4_BRAPC|nr:kinesin KIF23 isoform X3 [Brachionus plicatilis]